MSEVETGALGPGRIEPRELEQEMRSSFLDYASGFARRPAYVTVRGLVSVRDLGFNELGEKGEGLLPRDRSRRDSGGDPEPKGAESPA